MEMIRVATCVVNFNGFLFKHTNNKLSFKVLHLSVIDLFKLKALTVAKKIVTLSNANDSNVCFYSFLKLIA
jgi:hypothetical protein